MFQERTGQASETSTPADQLQLDDAEAQMRRALGLNGSFPRPKPEPERTEPTQRPAERFAFGGHRRRFVQDGDIPVTVVRRDPAAEPAVGRQPLGGPSSSRLQRAEAQLSAEVAARTNAERALAEAQSQVQHLQTKLGHAELAKNEALDIARRERESTAELRAGMTQQASLRQEAEERVSKAEQALEELQATLADERNARKAAEKALRAAEDAREAADRLVREMSEQPLPSMVTPPPARRATNPSAPSAPLPGRRIRVAEPAAVAQPEQEPVKWWLAATPARSRRR